MYVVDFTRALNFVETPDIVRFAQAFGAKGLRIESPDGISSTLKKALAILGPVLVGVPVDYRDNHRLIEIVHPEALNRQRRQSISVKNPRCVEVSYLTSRFRSVPPDG